MAELLRSRTVTSLSEVRSCLRVAVSQGASEHSLRWARATPYWDSPQPHWRLRRSRHP